jgi:hypothetical protein
LRILEASSKELREQLIQEFRSCGNNELPHHLSDKYPDNTKEFVETGDIMMQEPAFPFKNFFWAWDDNYLLKYFDNDVETLPHKEQPALSMKLGWLQVQLHCLLGHLVSQAIILKPCHFLHLPTAYVASNLRFFPVQ